MNEMRETKNGNRTVVTGFARFGIEREGRFLSSGGTGSVAYRNPPLKRWASAPVSALNRWDGSSHSGLDLTSIVEGNGVAARRGGEQPETNCRSVG